MSGAEENKDATAPTNDPTGESPPDNPPIIDESRESSDTRFNNDNITSSSSAPSRLETGPFLRTPRMMAGVEVGPDGFPIGGPYRSLSERMRLEEENNPPNPAPPVESSSSEENHQSSDEDPNTVIPFPMDPV